MKGLWLCLAGWLALGGCLADKPQRPRAAAAGAGEPSCVADADCGGGQARPCETFSCDAGRCRRQVRAIGFTLPDPVKGDCQTLECGVDGAVDERAAESDVPAPTKDCVTMSCQGAKPVETIAPGQACGSGGACTRTGSCAILQQLAVGNRHACVLLSNGTVECVGWDWGGQLSGQPATRLQRVAAPVPGLGDAVYITANDSQTCALQRDGSVMCAGDRGDARLAAMRGTGGPVIAKIEGIGPATLLGAAGHQGCVIHSEGVLACWGDHKPRARLIAKPRRPVAELVVGANIVCGVLDDRSVQCFRTPFDESPSSRSLVPEARKLHGVVALTFSKGHGCAVLAGGAVHCFGVNMNGEVDPTRSRGTNGEWRPLTEIAGLPPALSVQASFRHTCAVLTDHRVACWGWPNDGEGRGKLRILPWQARAIDLAYDFGCYLALRGDFRCWGDSAYGSSSTHPYKPDKPPWTIEL